MFIALDIETGNLVDAEQVDKTKHTYHCPLCNEQLVVRKGERNAVHFAHKSGSECDKDFKTSDMSEWHKTRQSLFKDRCREVIITNVKTGEKHIADVRIYNKYIIEFQHSKISSSEFNRRNDFYTQCGYKVIWVFDLSDIQDHLTPYYYKNKIEYNWKYPWRVWEDCDLESGDVIILIELEKHTRKELLEKRCWERILDCEIETIYEESGHGTDIPVGEHRSFSVFSVAKYELSNRIAFKTPDELNKLTSHCPKCGRLFHKYKMRSEYKFYFKCYHGW